MQYCWHWNSDEDIAWMVPLDIMTILDRRMLAHQMIHQCNQGYIIRANREHWVFSSLFRLI
eukprot:9731680-Ditylum_brightwellii.AAC.1